MSKSWRAHVIGITLTAILTTGLVIAGSYVFDRSSGGFEIVGSRGDAGLSMSVITLLRDPAHGEILAMAQQAARHLEHGRLVDALSPIALRDHGRCDWNLNTGFLTPDDIDRGRVRLRVKHHAAKAGIDVAFGHFGNTWVFVTVGCPA